MRIHQGNNLISGDARVVRDGLLPSALKMLVNVYQKVFMDTTLIGANTRYGFMLHFYCHHSLQSSYQLMSLHGADMMAADFQG